MNELAALTANNMFVITELMMLAVILVLLTHDYSDRTKKFLWVWMVAGVAIVFRVGYWSLAIALDTDAVDYMRCDMDLINCIPASDPYPIWFISHRWLMIPMALLYLGANIYFISIIRGLHHWQRSVLAVGVTGLAIFFALCDQWCFG